MSPLLAVKRFLPWPASGLVLALLSVFALGWRGRRRRASTEPGGAAPWPESGEEKPAAASAEGGEKPAAPPRPRTIDDDLEDVLKKHGGYEYAKGKKLDSAANLKRMRGPRHRCRLSRYRGAEGEERGRGAHAEGRRAGEDETRLSGSPR